jgi:FtsP/CotA-like multicopper oxidase with cupredoxin domain
MQYKQLISIGLLTAVAVLHSGGAPPSASAAITTRQAMLDNARTTGVPDYNSTPNWANSPPLRKFVDTLPGICGPGTAGENNLGQCLPVAVADTTTYPGSDYYEIELVQYRERMHSDFPALVGGDKLTATSGGTQLRGYRQTNVAAGADSNTPHYLGPLIVAQKDRPVRIKFTNSLPSGADGKLFIPVDPSVMGAGPGPDHIRVGDTRTESEVCAASGAPADCFTQNRGDIHLHGGRSPWISDGTAHQWITPAAEFGPGGKAGYDKGASVSYVPDMWFDASGNVVPECAGQLTCATAGATNNPGPGSQTYYFTNAQSARLMFYHDHAWGITRLNVYAGEAAGYIVEDDTEKDLVNRKLIPAAANTIPLIIQDKTFVNADAIVDLVTRNAKGVEIGRQLNAGTDPTWIWGSQPGSGVYGTDWSTGATPVTGDLWWPHVYMPAQNPYNPDLSGINPFGRWHYGPWFWPPTVSPHGPTANPYYDATPGSELADQPPEIPSTPNPSWGAEAFMDTPVVNGTAFPTLTVKAQPYRFRILNAAHDRFWNLQLYAADARAARKYQGRQTEVMMTPAVTNKKFPAGWPADNREGGVPHPYYRGPAMVQIATEGGFLPKPVVLPNRPVNWNVDVTTFTAGLVLQQNQGGGTLMLGPAERADVIIDFTKFAGRTLILYNDGPAPWPSIDGHYDYYTDAPDNRDMGGANTTLVGRGPNTRTIMQIKVAGKAKNGAVPAAIQNAVPANLTALNAAFAGLNGVFAKGQEPIAVGQKAYNSVYEKSFPTTWPKWGYSRITDTSLSFVQPDGTELLNYPIEPKAIQDEMGEVFDDYGRMSAKLGLEMAKTNANIQTFILQNFVDPPTEIVAKDQIQIWKITHNGVDTHPVHFHLFEVQLLNRVGWDGFIYLPDDNELGWKDTLRISPLEDTIVALRPAKVPVPFTVPNSMRPLNPAYPTGAADAGFTNLDPKTGQARAVPVTNDITNMGHEYLWHCHILSHEEQDMMRPIVLNANSLIFTDNVADGFWQWSRGEWTLMLTDSDDVTAPLTPLNPDLIVAAGTYAYATVSTDPDPTTNDNGLWQWNGYNAQHIDTGTPSMMATSGPKLYAVYTGTGLYEWKGATMTQIHATDPTVLEATETGLFASIPGVGLQEWNGTAWRATPINVEPPIGLAHSGSTLYANFTILGLQSWNGTTLTNIGAGLPAGSTVGEMVATGDFLYVNVDNANPADVGLYQWHNNQWTQLSNFKSTLMDASNQVVYAVLDDGTPILEKWDGTSWVDIDTGVLPTSLEASGSILYANFPVVGMRKYELGSWSTLADAPATLPTQFVAGF